MSRLKLYHCSYSLGYHFVFVTKSRRKCFTGAMLDRLKDVVVKLCMDWEAARKARPGHELHDLREQGLADTLSRATAGEMIAGIWPTSLTWPALP